MPLENAQFLTICSDAIEKGRALTEVQTSRLADLGNKMKDGGVVVVAIHAKAKRQLGPSHAKFLKDAATKEARNG